MRDSFRLTSPLFSEATSPLDSHDDPAAPEPPHEQQSWIQFVFCGPNGLRAGWRLLIFVLTLSVLSGALFLALRPFAHPRLAPANLSPSVEVMLPAEFLSALVVFLATYLMTKIEGRTFADYGLPWRKAFNARFWEGMAWGFAGITALLVALRAAGCFSFGAVALHGAGFARYAAAWGVMFLFVGFFEDMLLRGYPLLTLTTGIGFWPPAVLLSAAFGGIHLSNPGETLIGATGAALFGLVMCLTLRRTGDLWLAIGFHAAWDWGETFFYGVPDSGLVAPGHFLNSSFHGPNWLTGGSVGPEASVLTPVVLAAFWLVFSRRFPAVRYPNPASLGEKQPRS
jgi:membrane protease YdiL (CAAX protease family)